MNTSPDSRPDFTQQQLAFSAHIRDPEGSPAPQGIPAERLSVYRELIFNGFDSHLSTNFPVLRAICSDSQWSALVRGFLVRHRARTPLFTEIGLEFLDYLQHERTPAENDWPFLLELAHYEYAELAVAISDAETPAHDPNGDLLAGHPVVAASSWNLSYRYPVHRISPDFLPQAEGDNPTHLVVYRDRQDEVHFLEINAVTQRLLTLLQENPRQTGLEILQTIAAELGHARPDSVIEAGTRLLHELKERNVILGSQGTRIEGGRNRIPNPTTVGPSLY